MATGSLPTGTSPVGTLKNGTKKGVPTLARGPLPAENLRLPDINGHGMSVKEGNHRDPHTTPVSAFIPLFLWVKGTSKSNSFNGTPPPSKLQLLKTMGNHFLPFLILSSGKINVWSRDPGFNPPETSVSYAGDPVTPRPRRSGGPPKSFDQFPPSEFRALCLRSNGYPICPGSNIFGGKHVPCQFLWGPRLRSETDYEKQHGSPDTHCSKTNLWKTAAKSPKKEICSLQTGMGSMNARWPNMEPTRRKKSSSTLRGWEGIQKLELGPLKCHPQNYPTPCK